MKLIRSLLILAAISFGLMLLPAVAHADVNDFVIDDFAADYVLDNKDKQGRMYVSEKIRVTFSDNNHGILRSLPKTYKGHTLDVKINRITLLSGDQVEYSTYTENDNLVLKIGDPDVTVTGPQGYVIEYRVDNVIGFYNGHDELYWDINGDEWNQPFSRVKATFHLPEELRLNEQKCFTGSFGSTSQNCQIAVSDNKIDVTANGSLQGRETLTVVFGFNTGYFSRPTARDWWQDNYGKVLAVVVPPVLIGYWAYKRWRKNGKDLSGRGTIIPEYQPPDGLRPAEAAVVNNYRLNTNDVSATIIDLAIRGYIKIIETTEKKILKDGKNYEFELRNTDWSALKSYESEILSEMFASPAVGSRTDLKAMKNKFYKTIQSLQKELPAQLTKAGYFTSNPTKAGSLMYGIALALAIAAFALFSWITVGLLISAGLTAMFAALMPKRTPQGVAAKEALQGLKVYMNTAEKDRIKMLQSPGAPYAARAGEPKKTVELFEKLLPYAMVFGVEKLWAKQFADIYKTPPDWYGGNWSTFNTVNLTSAVSNSVGAMGTSFSPPSSSSGSGFSGGGSSGGGGGGGGGGGW